MRILIVDDSEIVRRGIVKLLSTQPGWLVCGEARNGEEGIELALQTAPDLVLLDVNMPGMDGLTVARRLRAGLPHVHILILSQHDTEHLLPRAIDAGAQGCVDKSRLSIELVNVIRSLDFSR